MRLIKKINELIFKIRDYDRLESDYIKTLEFATNNVLSKSSYTIESVYDAIARYWKEREKNFKKPEKRIEKILHSLNGREDCVWVMLSIYPCGRETHFFRGGNMISINDLSDDEKFSLYSWFHAFTNGYHDWGNYRPEKERVIKKKK